MPFYLASVVVSFFRCNSFKRLRRASVETMLTPPLSTSLLLLRRCAAPSSTSSSLQLTKLETRSRGHKNNCSSSRSSSNGEGAVGGGRKTCLKCNARFLVGQVGVAGGGGKGEGDGGPLRTDKWAARGAGSRVRRGESGGAIRRQWQGW